MKPVGRGVENHPRLKGLDIPPTGGGGWAYPLAIKTLLIAGHGSNMLAMDKATGEMIGQLELKDAEGKTQGRVSGSPLTYRHQGKQYIVVALTGGLSKAYLVGLALPRPKQR